MTDYYWLIFTAVATIASSVTAAVIGGLGIETKWLKRVVSWLVAIVLTYVSWFLDFMPGLGDPAWLWVLLQGVCVGLSSNGIYSIEKIKELYAIIFNEKS